MKRAVCGGEEKESMKKKPLWIIEMNTKMKKGGGVYRPFSTPLCKEEDAKYDLKSLKEQYPLFKFRLVKYVPAEEVKK